MGVAVYDAPVTERPGRPYGGGDEPPGPAPDVAELQEAVRTLFAIDRLPGGHVIRGVDLADWSEWPEAKRRAYETLKHFAGL